MSEQKMLKCKVLSIDAWRDMEGGWTWNAWYQLQDMEEVYIAADISNRALLKYCRDELEILSDASKGKIAVEDDGYNIVIMLKDTREPLFAFEYGGYWEENGL